MNLFNIKLRLPVFLGIYLLFNIGLIAQDNEIVEIGNLYPGEIEFGAFELLEESTINIIGKAANFGGSFNENLVFYGWILNSKTREIVWDAREDFDFDDEGGMYDFEDQEPLEAGKYEVYYACNNLYKIEINSVRDFISRVFKGSKDSFKKKFRSRLKITVTGEGGKFYQINPIKAVDSFVENSIVSFARVMDDEDLETGFSLNDDTEIRIYSIGEGVKKNIIDLAWISNVKTNKIVWKSSLRNSSHAGGGRKNYLVDEKIELPKGSYMLHYSSDDSHSFEEWNVMPPNDPQFWGATIWAVSSNDKSHVIPFNEDDVIKPIVELTMVGDDEFLSQGFSIKTPMKISILCLGEGYEEDDLSDYGWIINAETKEIIWTMNDNGNIKPAGGSKKNLMVEETINLEKGSYIGFYTSDDTHSFEDWNSSNPFQKKKWGLTIWSNNTNFELFDIDDFKSEKLISEIIRVRKNKNINKTFSLSETNTIRIIAIGEGERSRMYDYGWIQNNDGDVVWEMTYESTDHAGGGDKNRIFNDTIELSEGDYTLHYMTDGTHSFDSWNTSPPTDQDNYGITLMMENN